MHPKSQTAFGVFFRCECVRNAFRFYKKTMGRAGAHRHGANALCIRITRICVKKCCFGKKNTKNPRERLDIFCDLY